MQFAVARAAIRQSTEAHPNWFGYLVASWGPSGWERGLVVDGLQLDRRGHARATLTAPAVVGPFNPGHVREAEVLAGDPFLTNEAALREQGEVRLNSDVVAC